METGPPLFETLAFLEFELTLARRQLLRDGEPVAIGGRALDLLALLAARPGEVLNNRLLMRSVWPRTVVEEVNLRVQIAALRKLLGGDGRCPYIVNHAGRGYCFTAPVTRVSALPVHAGRGGRASGIDPAAAGIGREAGTGEPGQWRDAGAAM